jgi:type I restriction enzyme S subunit
MSKNNENKLIPRLRFPEFQHSEEWEVKNFGEVFSSYSGGTPNTSKKEYYGGDIPFIRSAEINKEKTELFLTELGIQNSSAKMVSKGDLLIALYGANSGDVAISKIDGAINQAVLCLKSEFSNSFAAFYLSGKKDWIVSKYIQGGQGNLSGEIVKSIPVPFPKKAEQQKIASCLSSLDEVIAGERQKLALLQQHKKGLLQQLFPQEGETLPTLRFKEFEDSGEWEVKKLGEVGEPLMCKRIFKNETTQNSKERVPFYKIGTFGRVADSYISKDIYEEYKIKYPFPKKGDILISASGTIGRLVIYDGAPSYFQDSNIIWLGHNEAIVLNSFLYYCYTKIKWQTSDGGVISRLYNSDFKGMTVCFPPNKSEQQKIATCLSSLDDIITAQTQKIELLEQHKKGLLQGLFPNVNDHG